MYSNYVIFVISFFFQAEDGIRDRNVTGVQTCALPIFAGDLAPVLVDLDLDLRAGERIALVGTNGAGKTTLMKLLTGLIVPRRGTVTVDGIDTRSRSAARLSDHVAYLY